MKEFFARLNPIERRFVVGVGVAFFVVINAVWVLPHFGDWSTTRAAMNDAQRKLNLFNEGISHMPEVQAAIAKYHNQGQVVPKEEQAVNFLRLILNQAAASGVGVLSEGSMRQSVSTNNPYFVEQNQTIQTQSGEKQLVDFLYNLGAGSSLIRVKVLSVQPDAPHQQLSARITLIASYQKKVLVPGAPAAAKTPAPAAAAQKPPAPAAPKPTTPTPAGTAPKPAPLNPAGTPKLPMQVPLNRLQATNRLNPLTPNKK